MRTTGQKSLQRGTNWYCHKNANTDITGMFIVQYFITWFANHPNTQSFSVEQLVTSHAWSAVVQPPSDLALKVEEAQSKWALSLPLKLQLATVFTVYHPGLINVCPAYLDSLKLEKPEGGSLDGF